MYPGRLVTVLLLFVGLAFHIVPSAINAQDENSDFSFGEHAFYPPNRSLNLSAVDITPTRDQPSAFMAGRIAVQAIFVESNGAKQPSTEDWTPSQISTITTQLSNALEWWRLRLPNANISFELETQVVQSSYEPIENALYDEGLWISDVLARMGFTKGNYFDQAYDADQALREKKQADWATTIFIVNSSNNFFGRFPNGPFAYAYIGGPFMVITSDSGSYGINNLAPVIAHELGHIFGALDQYEAAQVPCSQRSGYLAVPTSNSQLNNCGTNIPSIMLDPLFAYVNQAIDDSALGQVGYYDSNKNGLPDPLDTTPELKVTLALPASGGRPSVVAHAHDQPYKTSSMYHALTINKVTQIEYRVDGGEWYVLPPSDQGYNHADVQVSTTLPLYDGQHTVEFRAVNSVGNVSPIVKQAVEMTGVGAAPAYAVELAEYTNNPNVEAKVSAPSNAQVQISTTPAFSNSSWEAVATARWKLDAATDGPQRVYVRFRDAKGVESPIFARTITLDREAPTGQAVLQLGHQTTLRIDARDNVSGVVEMQLNNSKTWQPFESTLMLADANVQSVRLRDAAGNISNAIAVQSFVYAPFISR